MDRKISESAPKMSDNVERSGSSGVVVSQRLDGKIPGSLLTEKKSCTQVAAA